MIIKFEEQFCSLDYAIKFKELGIDQYSYFYWGIHKDGNKFLFKIPLEMKKKLGIILAYEYSAFSVVELIMMYPEILLTGELLFNVFNHPISLVNSLSSRIIYYLENKLVSVREINERLLETYSKSINY